jgi:hypothetical protein
MRQVGLVLRMLPYESLAGEADMPLKGEVNKRFGVYQSVCCDAEIVITEGAVFPDCPNHANLPTKWKSAADEPIRHVHELPDSKRIRKDPAA